MIKLLKQFKFSIIVSAILFALGFLGGSSLTKTFEEKKLLECQQAQTEQILKLEREYNLKLKEANEIAQEVQYKYIEDIKRIANQRSSYQKAITEVRDSFELSNASVEIFNSAAKGKELDMKNINSDPSGVQYKESLEVTAENFSTCQSIRSQLIALQEYNKKVSDE